MFRKLLDEGRAGDNVGLLLRGVEQGRARAWQVLASRAAIKPHTKFKARSTSLRRKREGVTRRSSTDYRPQFYFRTTDVTGSLPLSGRPRWCMPGDNVNWRSSSITPIAMEKELRFAIREGGRTVGAGVVTAIIE